MLESVGIKIGDMRLIWLKEDGDYEIIKIAKMNDSILDRVLAK
jgi:predicted nuclease of predicted toxin-antitoxin system